MSMMSTLAKLAIGYAAARGVDKMSGGQGIGGLIGGAKINPKEAQTPSAPGMEPMQDMMAQMGGQMGDQMAGLQDMIAKMTSGSGFDLNAMLGGLTGAGGAAGGGGKDAGGLLGALGGGGAGLAGILSAMGGAAAASGQGVGSMIDQFGASEALPEADKTAGLLLRAMIQAAKSDGEIDEDEQARIMDTLGADADAGDIAFVREQLAAPVDPEGLAADTPNGMQGQVYSMSLMSIRLDRQGEAMYLDRLARALGLNQQMVNGLHAQMGAQPLYG